jgi:hypothetical protein
VIAAVSWVAIVRDADTGPADRFRSLPMPRSAALIGRPLSDAVVFLAQALVMIGVGYLLGFRVHTGLAGFAGIVVTAIAFGTALSVTCAWLALQPTARGQPGLGRGRDAARPRRRRAAREPGPAPGRLDRCAGRGAGRARRAPLAGRGVAGLAASPRYS